jgi:hypothetical protein
MCFSDDKAASYRCSIFDERISMKENELRPKVYVFRFSSNIL